MAVFHGIEHLPAFFQTVITIGTFDGVHKGHQEILAAVRRRARHSGGESLVITFDPHPRKLLYPEQHLPLLTPLGEKIKRILAEGIDHVIVVPFTKSFSRLDARAYITDFLVARFHPAYIVIGYDHRFGNDRSGDITLLTASAGEFDFQVEELPARLIDEAAISSTKIRRAIQEGAVASAAHMLGRQYELCGTVVKGAQLGRTIGYPTANIIPADADQQVPGNGVYGVHVKVGEKQYGGMMNIGFRPTVSQERILSLEVHVFDFSGDLYGQQLTITFLGKLRDEQKFAGIDSLKAQLHADELNARKLILSIAD